ncbi:thioredoxin family protein [Paenibacillus sp. LHD-38]|uniref:thioredoxin family protein n=1 Tax=Paenibacillus sp. LHD-38 TaxID=3072143 RepID=UPI00280CF525|nr:thioredoxin family protein [Paenibacillus sp. LHD-38]MDQ8736639.1 thioredoxin family protein [Paenibacillus sp. LHD-38]
MAIQEIDEASLQKVMQDESGKAAVYFFTPLCGTCKIGERMLEIAEMTGISVPLHKLNINYAPQLREQWKIASVPCLVLIENGKPVQKEYAMKSVDHVYLMLK